jgi:hypothetical protein
MNRALSSNRSRYVPLVLFGVSLMVLAGVFAVRTWEDMKYFRQVSQASVPSDWKTYDNAEFGISLRYPGNVRPIFQFEYLDSDVPGQLVEFGAQLHDQVEFTTSDRLLAINPGGCGGGYRFYFSKNSGHKFNEIISYLTYPADSSTGTISGMPSLYIRGRGEVGVEPAQQSVAEVYINAKNDVQIYAKQCGGQVEDGELEEFNQILSTISVR